MLKSCSSLLLIGALLLSLTACESRPVNKMDLMTDAHFWQRTETSSAIYQRGPKAQQMLHRDISRCVTELRELERLGAIRRATPGDMDSNGNIPDPHSPEGSMAQWDTPERDGYLRAENLDYHDFETCMMAKGWERIEYVPYDVAEESRADYIEAVTGEQYRTKTRKREPFMSKPEGDFDNLNE